MEAKFSSETSKATHKITEIHLRNSSLQLRRLVGFVVHKLLRFTLPDFIPRLLDTHLSSEADTMEQFVAEVPSGLCHT
jgi:hypothetical protein